MSSARSGDAPWPCSPGPRATSPSRRTPSRTPSPPRSSAVPPRNPGAWILTTARNRAVDRIRREQTLARKTRLLEELERLAPPDTEDQLSSIPDERLALVFACCHPALAAEARVALTLRSLGGLS